MQWNKFGKEGELSPDIIPRSIEKIGAVHGLNGLVMEQQGSMVGKSTTSSRSQEVVMTS